MWLVAGVCYSFETVLYHLDFDFDGGAEDERRWCVLAAR